jgi:lipopolysaccharide transport protein LptA
MKPVKSLCLIFISLSLMLSGSVYSETKKTANIFNSQDGKIKIDSISWEMDIKNSIGTFSGDVEVEGDDIAMSCQKLEVYFKNIEKDASIKSVENRIIKIIALESVVIKRPVSGGYATAEKAEFIIESEKIFLTGNPYFTDGKGYEGHAPKIIIDIKEDSYSAEGTKEDKATLSRTEKDER